MTKRLAAAALLGVIAALAFCAVQSLLGPTPAQAQLREPAIVAAFAYKTHTRFTQDPFDPNRIAESEARVEKIILVRADGTTDFKYVADEK